jgi:multidrug efflux system membrane fusion protein
MTQPHLPIRTIVPKMLAAAMLAAALAACGQGQPQQQAAPPPPQVTVAKPTQKTVVDHDEYVGRFVPVESVEIRARVSGYLAQVHFNDGQMVKEGDLLFTIDRRPFQNARDQARAALTQARSNQSYTEADLTRAQQLVRDKTITEQSFDQRLQAKRNRPHRRPACLPRQSRHRRHPGQPDPAGDHRQHRPDPLRVHLR